jgi:hypothetical protein
MTWKLLALCEFAFAALLAAWALGTGPGESARTGLGLGFAGYSALAALIGLGALQRRRGAAWLALAFGVGYLVPGGWAFAASELWAALAVPPAAVMLTHFGAAIVTQLLAVACGLTLLRLPVAPRMP